MSRKLAVWILMMLILVVGALAVNPHTPQTATSQGIDIQRPQNPFFWAGIGDLGFYFHVYNSTGYELSAPETNCTMDIYNNSNAHLQLNVLAVMENGEYKVVLGPNITEHPGRYPYIIECESIKEAGFLSDFFEIEYGAQREDVIGGYPLAVIILLPILFAALLMVGLFHLDEEHKTLKIILFLFAYVMVFFSFWMGTQAVVRYYYFMPLQDSMTTLTWVVGIGLFVVLSYFLIYAFIMGIEAAAQKKRERLEY